MILELFTILSASVLEGIILQRGSDRMAEVIIKDNPSNLRLCFGLWFILAVILYVVFAIRWCFSDILIEQVAGVYLMSMTGLGIILRGLRVERKSWYLRLDAMLSLVFLLLVGYNLIRGSL